jgi:hypothetical protein
MTIRLPKRPEKIRAANLFLAEQKYTFYLFFSLTALLFILPHLATAQRMYPDMGATISSKGSDYDITFDWVDMDRPECNINPGIEIYKNGDEVKHIVYKQKGTYSNNGSLKLVVGPNQGGYYGLRYDEGQDCNGCCYQWTWSGFPRADNSGDKGPGYSVLAPYTATVAIKPPTGVTASDQTGFDHIELKWSKGTDIPDSNSFYRIYRGSELIHTANGDQRSWKDASLDPGQTRTYTIRTYASKWGGHQSSGVTVTGSTRSMGLTASDGTFASRVRLEWVNISSFADNIRIERNLPNSSVFEEIDILNKNATFYNDLRLFPGIPIPTASHPLKTAGLSPPYTGNRLYDAQWQNQRHR